MCPEHGGKLALAARTYGIARQQWLDLSTGLSPLSFPLPQVSPDAWHRLPDDDGTLEAAACQYYGTTELLAIAGSQAAIQQLPRLRCRTSRVAIVHPTYNEHQYWWQHHGFSVERISHRELHAASTEFDVVVLANPNNPDGQVFPPEQLLLAQINLASRGGWLIVDEAFVDTNPETSLTSHAASKQGLIVLRSLGKFFGLAGARVGFVAARPRLLEALKELLGPWTIAGPAKEVAAAALTDLAFHESARIHLRDASERLLALLSDQDLQIVGGTDFFVTIYSENAEGLHDSLARRAILTRLFPELNWIRFGLPGSETEWNRVSTALREICSPVKSQDRLSADSALLSI